MKNRIVNNTGATLPMACEDLIDLVDQYINDAIDCEDVNVLKETSAEDRLKDFIFYVATTRNVNLLDVMHLVDIEKEDQHG